MDLAPGAVVAGRYRVERKVGAGGMGEVWLGENIAVGVRIAVKTLLAEPGADHEVVARFKREAYILGKVRSDYIARILDFVTDENYGTVLVMEFVEGDSLAKLLQYKKLSIEETIELGADIAAGIVDLHRVNIIHRDLKPGNVILQPLPDGRKRAVIVDFGVSRVMAGDDPEEEITGITKAGMALGTLEYMSPEQILSSRDAKMTADVYALGAILWRALIGKHVFGDIYDVDLAQKKIRVDPPELPMTRSDGLALGLRACIARAIKRRPSERYQRASDMLNDLIVLRDLARAAAIDLDAATTQDATDSAVLTELAKAAAKASTPKPAAEPAPAPTPEPARAEPSEKSIPGAALAAPATTSLSAASASIVIPDAPVRRGVPAVVFAATLLLALAGGAAGGRFWQLSQAPAARECPSVAPTATAAETATAAATATTAPAATTTAAADVASAEPATSAALPTPSASADAGAIDLDGLDPASRAALDGTMPTTHGIPGFAFDGGVRLTGRLPTPASATPSAMPRPNAAPVGSIKF